VWLCGATPGACYAGLVHQRLIDPASPAASLLGDPVRSPLRWVAPDGPMPLDQPAPLPAGRDAILAWIAGCAPNN
jgi:hypothetical protein